ncbi:hypothetical protein H5410_048763 [Solanum commersonii]|uniref:Uncharacterized protein n=1 Tax=Solanum commersonii TaxID=4109 RepID=A0A9J5XJ30_SOLCO|nr:hypothetical protein H5410_048763 [Solanum commersonii]
MYPPIDLQGEGDLIVGMDMSLWYVFGSIPPISIIIGIMLFLGDPTVNKWLLIPDTILMFLGHVYSSGSAGIYYLLVS